MSAPDQHDVVIVGAGVAGSLVAKYLTKAGVRVLLLEAGPGTPVSYSGYMEHLETFYKASSKGAESAWPPKPEAPQPDGGDLKNNNGYFIQRGPNIYGSSYTRSQGGSTLHWLGVSLRMLREDFHLRTNFGVARDWPIGYDDIEPYYRKAEYEMGVAADVADQRYLGHTFPPDYDYPMQKVPLSYSDQQLANKVNGLEVAIEGEAPVPITIRSYPAARNSTPRGSYVPLGAVDIGADGRAHPTYIGQRCQGNTSCTPICPVQAKYNAGKSLAQADRRHLHVLTQAVASKINVDPLSGKVTSITYKRYDGTRHTVHEARGGIFVLAAHAVENAKLMLISGLTGQSDQVGRNMMDHPALYAWGLADQPIGAFRGPLSTAGLEDFRGGTFRGKHAAFRFDIGNDGWKASTGAPDTAVTNAVVNQKIFGPKLRSLLASTVSRQVRFSLAVEQLPSPENRVTLDPRCAPDPLGNPRPVVNYHVDEYTMKGMLAANKVYQAIFARAGITDYTQDPKTPPAWFPTAQYNGQTFHYHGMGHFAGTHAMGDDPRTSVTDHWQRAWDHANLYLVGAGSFPTMGTSNPTLTLSALAIRTAEHLITQLKGSAQ